MPRDTLVITPWGDYSELIQLKDAFYNPSHSSQRRSACETVRTWELLGNVPHAVVATAELTNALMFDSEGNGGAWDRLGIYMSAWTRFVDGMTDTQQIYRVKRSMYDVARDLGMPAAFVELRHRAVHEQKPTLLEFRREVRNGLSWLFQWFWAYVVPEDGGEEEVVDAVVAKAAGGVAETRTGTGTGSGTGGARSTASERQGTLRLTLKKRTQAYLAECRSSKASSTTVATSKNNNNSKNKKKDHHNDQTSPASNSVHNHAATSFAEDMLTLYGDDNDDDEEGLLRELARFILLEGARLGDEMRDQKAQKAQRDGQRRDEMEVDSGSGSNARRRGKKVRTRADDNNNSSSSNNNDNGSDNGSSNETSFSFPHDLESALLATTHLLPHFVIILEQVLLTTIAVPHLPNPYSSSPSSSDLLSSDAVCNSASSLLITMHTSDSWRFTRETGLLDMVVAGEVCGEYGNGNGNGNGDGNGKGKGNRWTRVVLDGLSL